ncbi:MAG: hypothetical protein M3336_16225, partial [Chloroflexota bacterium]|nr:hypothetical protein [Chloroflexota bacterium]
VHARPLPAGRDQPGPVSSSPKHLALVPVVAVDGPAQRALEYAARLAQQVLAVHVRQAGDGPGREFEATWATRLPAVPLMIVDGSAGDWERSFLEAIDSLRRTGEADLITVVFPPSACARQAASTRPASAAMGLRMALRRRPGVVVWSLPSSDPSAD